MSLGDQVRATFKAEYDAGDTYREIADRHGVSYTYVRGIILGIDPPGGISLAKLETMFPRATLDLRGASSPSSSPRGRPDNRRDHILSAAENLWQMK